MKLRCVSIQQRTSNYHNQFRGYNETSLCFDPSETGLFTYFLCAGLQGKADKNNDGKITTGELQNYIKNNVIEISTKIHGRQTPQFYGNKNVVLGEY